MKLLLVIFFAISGTANLSAQPFQQIKYLGIDQGLSNNSVTSICKDAYGYIWIGTYDGLNRYDGTSVKIFRNIWNDSLSLNSNHINKLLAVDKRIFVGTQKGVMYFDYNTARFYPVHFDLKSEGPKAVKNISTLAGSTDSNVYIGTENNGFFVYDISKNKARQIPLDHAGNEFSVQAVTVSPSKDIWVFVKNIGLCCYNKQQQKLQVVNAGIRSAYRILPVSEGRLWIGGEHGLFELHAGFKNITPLQIKGELTCKNITDLAFVKGQLWIATDGGGINVMDTASRKLETVLNEKNVPMSLKSNSVSVLFPDEHQRVFVSTLRGGVNIFDDIRNQFKLIAKDPFNANSLISNFIISFCEDEKGNLWVGTDGGGLSFWNRKNNTYTNYVHSDRPGALSSNFVVSMVRDPKNSIWVGMYNGGIDRFDSQTGLFTHYTCNNPVTNAEDNNLWKLYIDREKRLWAGTTSGGLLYVFDEKENRFKPFDGKLNNIHAIIEDHQGFIWVGDYSHLIKINPVTKKYHYISVQGAVRTIVEGQNHRLWVGTEGGGLINIDPENEKMIRYTGKDGLPSNSILNLVVDHRGRIWGSTYNGVTVYDPQKGKFSNYTAADGLQSNQFNFNAGLLLKSGEIAFGGIKGFNIFFPDSIKAANHRPRLLLNGLRVNNKNIEDNQDFTAHTALPEIRTLTIPYDQATLAIDYTAIDYSFPEKIQFAYYLEGWDHGWNDVGRVKTAYYTRLNEGTYYFKVKVSNNNGVWDDQQLSLKIIVLPPWYRTWYAYLIYITLISGIIYIFWQYRIRQTKLKYEIQIANLTVEREKELNEKKLAFFTNVSHEFRSPLTLIINPIKDMLNRMENRNNSELNIAYRNARRLLGLVDHLLLFRKAETENDQLNLSKLDFPAMCHDVFLCFSYQAKTKHINYEFSGTSAPVYINADREKLEIALFNLISNAIKFTPAEGRVNVTVGAADEAVYVEVADTGKGIPEETAGHIFDKFYQVKDHSSVKTGFGIGLYLVKSFVLLHHGEVVYERNRDGGATFKLWLPKPEELIAESIDESDKLLDELQMDDATPGYQSEEQPGNLELLISDRQSILVIDDNAELRTYIKSIFKDDFRIYEAPDAEEGLELIRAYLPDLVISDIVMNEVSGIELCKIIKQDLSLNHIPVVLLSGDSDPETKLEGIVVGAVDFVTKPFEKDLLIARVTGILKDRKQLQNYFYNEVTLKSNVKRISDVHKEFLYKCISVIENYLADPDFDVETIANELGMSYSGLFKKVKLASGQSVNSLVRFVRLRKAAEIMIHTNCNVNEAALKTGFGDMKYFREHFKRQFGLNPSEFIRKHRTAFNSWYRVDIPA
ncbi:hypothetical protein BEL04_05475 [Mucilaginibacter sp. PPCGB 2223]|nr:hypothetical protein BEL04_05475 [Mucilaginibacter sp. PPCGB 2223]